MGAAHINTASGCINMGAAHINAHINTAAVLILPPPVLILRSINRSHGSINTAVILIQAWLY